MRTLAKFMRKPVGVLTLIGVLLLLLGFFSGNVSADTGILGNNSSFFWIIVAVAGGVFVIIGIMSFIVMMAASDK